ncbi:MAG: thiamine phosphate synthase, partial [Alphaproteobacteria bacterium]
MANRPVEPAAEENGAVEGDEPRPRCRLYLITPPDLAVDGPALEAFGEVLAEALDAGDVACVQLRLKDVTDDDWRRAAAALAPIVQSRDVAFILNDRADLVAELG